MPIRGLRRDQQGTANNKVEKKADLRNRAFDYAAANEAARGQSDVGKAFRKGLRQTEAGLRGAVSAAAGAAGNEELALAQARKAEELQRLAAESAPSVDRLEDVKDIGTGAQFVANKLAEQAPNIATTLLGGGAGRALAGAARAGKTAAKVATGAGSFVPGAALETGGIQTELLGDEQARKDRSVQELSRLALTGGTAAGALEALPVVRVFDKFGVGKAGRRAVQKALGQRLAGEAAKGAVTEGLTEAAQTAIERGTHKFANENIDVFGDEGLREIVEAAVTGATVGAPFGAVGGIPQGSKLDERIADLEARDELATARARTQAQRAFGQNPEALQDLEQQGFDRPEVQQQAAEAALSFDRDIEASTAAENPVTTRIAAGHFKGKIENIQQFNDEVSPILKGIATGELNFNDPNVQTFLSKNFNDPDKLLDRVARAIDAPATFEQNTLLGAVSSGAVELTDPLPGTSGTIGDRIRQLGGNEALAEVVETDPNLLGEETTGEAGPEFLSINVSEGPSTEFQLNSKGLPWLSRKGAERIHGREFSSSTVENSVAKANERGDGDYKEVPYSAVVKQEARDQGLKTKSEISGFLAQRAEALLQTKPETESLYFSGDPEGYLYNFSAVEFTKPSPAIQAGDLEIEQARLNPQFSDKGKRKKARLEEIKRGGEEAFDEETFAEADRRLREMKTELRKATGPIFSKHPGPGKELFPGQFEVTVDGKKAVVNAKNLTASAIGKEGVTDAAGVQRVADQFSTMLSSLLNLEGRDVKITELPDDLVIFEPSAKRAGQGAKPITYGEIKSRGAARVSQATGPAARKRLNEALRAGGKQKERQASLERFQKGLAFVDEQRGQHQAVRDLELVSRRIRDAQSSMEQAIKRGQDAQVIDDRLNELKAQRETLQRNPDTQRFQKARKRLNEIRKEDGMREVVSSFFELERQKRSFRTQKEREQAKATPEAREEARIQETESEEEFLGKQSKEPGDTSRKVDTLATREGVRKIDVRGNDVRVQFDDNVSGQFRQRVQATINQDSARTRSRDRSIAERWLKGVGIDAEVEIMSVPEALKLLKTQRNMDKMLRGGTRGFAVKGAEGKVRIFVHPRLEGGARLSTLAHEVGHIIFNRTAASMTHEQQAEIKSAFETWRNQFGRSATEKDVLEARKPFLSLVDTMARRHTDRPLSELPKAGQDYLLDFEEWFADNTAKWLTTDAKPLNAVEEFFSKVASFIKDLFQIFKNDIPDAAVAEYLDSLFDSPTEHTVTTEQVADAAPSFDEIPDDALDRIADMLHRVTGIRPTVGDENTKTEFRNRAVKSIWISSLANEDTYGEATNQAMRAAFELFLNPEERGILTRSFTSSPAMRKLRELLVDDIEALDEINSNPEAAAAYGYQFWTAGQLKLGPQTRGVFEKIVDFINGVLGVVQGHKQAEQILNAVNDGRVRLRAAQNLQGNALTAAPDFVVQRRVNATVLQKAREYTEIAGGYVAPVFQKLFFTADGQMRATKNPWLIKLADKIHPAVGSEHVGETMFESRVRMVGRFTNIMQDIYEGKDEAFGQHVLAALQGRDQTVTRVADNKAVDKAVRRTRILLRQLLNYQRESGIDIADRGPNYFPRVVDVDEMQRRSDEFVAALAKSKYDEHLARYLRPRPHRMTQELRMAAARRVMQAYLIANGDTDSAGGDLSRGTGAPFSASANERTLGWIEDADIEPYLNKDLGLTMTRYIDQAVKRAEYAKRFKEDGSGFKDLLNKAERTGATPQDIERAYKYMQAMMGTIGGDISPKHQKLQGAVMVYQNLRLLALSTLTSLADPVGIAVRGDLGAAWSAFKAGIDEVKAKARGDQTELRKLAAMLGTIDTYMSNEALGWEYGGHFVTGKARKINESFFRWIGLQSWTRNTRLMALAGASSFLEKHASGEGKHSKRFLSQLDLKPEDVKLDRSGNLLILTNRQRRDLEGTTLTKKVQGETVEFEKDADEIAQNLVELERDDKVRAALNRWVNEAILRPDAAQRPVWASDPHWMLVFHLKSFMYSFHDRILKRVGSELQEGNFWPLIYLQGFIPVMIAADFVRDGIQGALSDDDDDRKADWDFFDYSENAAERSGMTGLFQLAKDANRDVKYGGIGVESFAGPTAQQVIDFVRLPLEGDRKKWKTFQRSLPANNIWREWNFSLE